MITKMPWADVGMHSRHDFGPLDVFGFPGYDMQYVVSAGVETISDCGGECKARGDVA